MRLQEVVHLIENCDAGFAKTQRRRRFRWTITRMPELRCSAESSWQRPRPSGSSGIMERPMPANEIVITGAAGLVGRYLVPRLKAQHPGVPIVAVDKHATRRCATLSIPKSRWTFSWSLRPKFQRCARSRVQDARSPQYHGLLDSRSRYRQPAGQRWESESAEFLPQSPARR